MSRRMAVAYLFAFAVYWVLGIGTLAAGDVHTTPGARVTPRPIALFWIAAAAGFAMAGMAWNLVRPVEGELGATTTAGGVGRQLVAWCRITLSLVVSLALPQAIHATRGDR